MVSDLLLVGILAEDEGPDFQHHPKVVDRHRPHSGQASILEPYDHVNKNQTTHLHKFCEGRGIVDPSSTSGRLPA